MTGTVGEDSPGDIRAAGVGVRAGEGEGASADLRQGDIATDNSRERTVGVAIADLERENIPDRPAPRQAFDQEVESAAVELAVDDEVSLARSGRNGIGRALSERGIGPTARAIAPLDGRVPLIIVCRVSELDDRPPPIPRGGVVDHEPARAGYLAGDDERLVGPVGGDVARGVERDRAAERARHHSPETRPHDRAVPRAAVGGLRSAGV